MTPKAHAILSASSSHRWLNCPPSALLCANAPGEGTASEYAAEGTCAHELSEFRLKQALGIPAQDPIEHLTYYNEEMEDCANAYASYISEIVEEAKANHQDPIVLIEQRLDFSRFVADGFGTGDCVIIADGTLNIVDLKYGLGVLVDATDNPQMKLYALGALEIFDCLYDINEVRMTIFQPRRENIGVFTMTKADLYDWAEHTLKPIADLAYKGEGEFKAGGHCQFCKVKSVCRERAKRNLELAKYDFKLPSTLEDSEIEYILGMIDDLVSWATDVKEYALQAAISGKEWKGYKLVEGRSNRKYTDETAVIEAVKEAGYDPYEHKILGITAMTSLLGKKKFEALLGTLVEKPAGKPTLVADSDKRPAINNAKTDFKGED